MSLFTSCSLVLWPFGLCLVPLDFVWIIVEVAFCFVFSWGSDDRKSVQPLLNSNWLARQKILNSKSPIKSRLLQSAGVGPSAHTNWSSLSDEMRLHFLDTKEFFINATLKWNKKTWTNIKARPAMRQGKAEKLKAVIDAPRRRDFQTPTWSSLRWSTLVTRTPDVPPQVGVYTTQPQRNDGVRLAVWMKPLG